MSGECDKCGKHALECKCMFTIKAGKGVILPKIIKISIDKEYFIIKFKKIFDKWDYKLANGMDMYDAEEFFNDLINTM